MSTTLPTLSYLETHHSTFRADWFANFSVLAMLAPVVVTLAAFFCLFLLPTDPAIDIIGNVMETLNLAFPIVGLSLAITALLLKTRFRKTAISGLIGCSLLVLPTVLSTIVHHPIHLITRHPAAVIAAPATPSRE